MNSSYLWLIPLLPFVGFLFNGTIGRKLPRAAVTGIALLFTAIPAVIVAYLWIVMKAAGAPEVIRAVSAPWIAITGFQVNFAFTVDHLTLIPENLVVSGWHEWLRWCGLREARSFSHFGNIVANRKI